MSFALELVQVATVLYSSWNNGPAPELHGVGIISC
jgi:hypothetical protein